MFFSTGKGRWFWIITSHVFAVSCHLRDPISINASLIRVPGIKCSFLVIETNHFSLWISPQRLRKDESSTYRCISNSELVVYLQTVSNAQIQFCIFHYLRGACHWSILIPYRAQHDRYPLLPIWKHESPPPTRGAECVRAPRSSSSATCVHFRIEIRHSFAAQGSSTQNIHKRTRCGT